MGQGKSKQAPGHGLHIGVGEAHAVAKHPAHHSHTDIHGGVHHPIHSGHESVAHHVIDWSNELFSRRVQEGDTLWHLSERYLGDGNKWPHLQSACELDRDPHRLIPGRPITHYCISKARDEARHHHNHAVDLNPLHHLPGHHQRTSSSSHREHHITGHTKLT